MLASFSRTWFSRDCARVLAACALLLVGALLVGALLVGALLMRTRPPSDPAA